MFGIQFFDIFGTRFLIFFKFAVNYQEVIIMRLDKFLKVSRLIKRRTVANDACDASRISVNGRPAKASYDVKIGDLLEMKLAGKSVKVEVVSLQPVVGKENASALYRFLD